MNPFNKPVECKVASLTPSGGKFTNPNMACSILFHQLDLIDLTLSSLSVGQSVWCVIKFNHRSNVMNAHFISSSEQITEEKWQPQYKRLREQFTAFKSQNQHTKVILEPIRSEAEFIKALQLAKYNDPAISMD